jgi:hypothetical protein
VYDCDKGVFLPSWKAQKEGWRLVKTQTWFQRLLMRLFFDD